MKTYTKTIEKTGNRLEITHDESPDSPREWSNLGYFIAIDSNYQSPDENETLYEIIKETGQLAESQEKHIEEIKKQYEEETDEKVLAIYPVVKYEHSGVNYSLGTKHGFDYSNNGFYIITDKTQKETGTEEKDWEKVIEIELELYNKWANGEVYGFILFDENGEDLDSCGGFYNIEDIREHLSDEWKNEDLDEYIVY